MVALGIAISLDLAFVLLGRRLLRLVNFDLPSGENLVFSYALGAGTLCLATLGIGLLGLLRPWVALALVLLPFVIGYEDLRVVPLQVWNVLKGLWPRPEESVGRIALIVLSMNIAINVVAALAPPTGTDTLSARLAVPKAYVEAGRIIFLKSNLHAGLPQNIEMLYALCMLFGSDVAPQVLHLSFGVCFLLALYCLAKRYLSPRGAVLTCLLFYSLTDVVPQFTWAVTDLAVGLFSLLAFMAWFFWWELRDLKALLLAGLLAGFAAGSKMNAMAVLASLALVTASVSWESARRETVRALGNGLLVSLPAFAVFAPWLIKDLILTGNPIFPFMAGVFGGQGITPNESALFFAHAMRNSTIHRGALALLTLPWDMTFFGQYTSGTIGPLFLIALVFVPWLNPAPPVFRPIVWLAVPFGLIWYWADPLPRFAFAILGLLAMITVWAFGRLAELSRLARAVCVACASLWFLVATGNNIRIHEVTFPFALGMETREQYLERVLPLRGAYYYFEDSVWMNAHLPPGATVLSWTVSNYYLERPWIFVDRMHAYADTSGVDSPQAFARLVQKLRISYLFVLNGGHESRYCPVPKADEFIRELAASGELQEIWHRSQAHVYKLRGGIVEDSQSAGRGDSVRGYAGDKQM